MEGLTKMWLARLRSIALSPHRGMTFVGSAIAIAFIFSGLVFAAQTTRQDDPTSPAGRKALVAKADKSATNSSILSEAVPEATSTSVTPPQTILGPNGETITLPLNPAAPSQEGSQNPPTEGSQQSPTESGNNPGQQNNNPGQDQTPNNGGNVFPSGSTPPSTTTTVPPTIPPPVNQYPQLNVTASSNPEDPMVTLNINMSDADSVITGLSITWDAGDENPYTVAYTDTDACDAPMPNSRTATISNLYTNPGTHNISVTVISTTCGSSDPQAASQGVTATSGEVPTTTTIPVDGSQTNP